MNAALDMRGKTWAELGRYIGITRAGYARWKIGSIPDADTLLRIGDWLNVRGKWLLWGRLPMSHPPSISDDERTMLELYRHLDADSRRAVHNHAAALAARPLVKS